MNRFLLGLVAYIGLIGSAHGQTTFCGKTYCYDYCTHNYVMLDGDTCDKSFDFNRGCYQATAYCRSNQQRCPNSIRCWDYCDSQMVELPHGNSCGMDYDSQRGCWRAKAECN